jgi:hypothetical protein
VRYDTVGKLGWSVDLRTHPIKVVIEQVLSEDWEAEEGRQVPFGEPEAEDCVVSFLFARKSCARGWLMKFVSVGLFQLGV